MEFNTLKQTILKIIETAEIIIDAKRASQEAGIYMLYVDNFSNNKIIPFYIGETINFRQRFQQHLKDVKTLMQYTYAEYHNKFFWSAVSYKREFEGKYRACKIFKYIIDHNCTIDDIKMIILEKCNKEELKQREQYYLSTYLPAYFGFNQIATVTEYFKYRSDEQTTRLLIEEDLRYFQNYMEYGYSTFNYLHAFAGYGSPELNQKVNLLTGNHLWSPREDLFSCAISAFENYQRIYQDAYTKIYNQFSMQIHEVFESCGFKSKGRESDVVAAFTNHYRTSIIDDIDDNLDYLEYYFDRNSKSQKCGELIKEIYCTNAEEISQIIAPVEIAFKSYLNSRHSAIEQSEFSIIFPKKVF